jgi:hypothetical protein
MDLMSQLLYMQSEMNKQEVVVTMQLSSDLLDPYYDEERHTMMYGLKQQAHDWLNRESGFWIFDENDVLTAVDPSKYLYRVRVEEEIAYLDFYDSVLAVKFRLVFMAAETHPFF